MLCRVCRKVCTPLVFSWNINTRRFLSNLMTLENLAMKWRICVESSFVEVQSNPLRKKPGWSWEARRSLPKNLMKGSAFFTLLQNLKQEKPHKVSKIKQTFISPLALCRDTDVSQSFRYTGVKETSVIAVIVYRVAASGHIVWRLLPRLTKFTSQLWLLTPCDVFNVFTFFDTLSFTILNLHTFLGFGTCNC